VGGARTVLATVTSAETMTSAIDGLAVRGRLVVVGVDAKPIQVSPLQLIGASRSVVGHAAGASIDSQDTLAFSSLSGVRPMIERMPLARAADAYARMMWGDARFRMVLTRSSHAIRRCSGGHFPQYELSDHTAKRRKLSELQRQHPMVLVLRRGGYCPKDRRQAEGLVRLHRELGELEVGYCRLVAIH
jgi:hypothetical protein